MSARPIKARRMWRCTAAMTTLHASERRARQYGQHTGLYKPVGVIDLSNPTALASQLDAAVGNAGDWSYGRKPTVEEITSAVMDSLGLSPRQRKARR